MVASAARFEVHCATYPLPGIREPSDVAMAIPIDGGLAVAIVDPVGKGVVATRIAIEAATVLRRSARLGVGEALIRVQEVLAGSAGVSLAMARLGPEVVEFGGIGRVYGALLDGDDLVLLESDPGTVGVGLQRPPSVARFAWNPGQTLVLAADGLVDCWNLAAARGHAELPMTALSHRLAGSATRPPEDTAIVVVRESR